MASEYGSDSRSSTLTNRKQKNSIGLIRRYMKQKLMRLVM
jgi:hypothetical protein